MEYLKVVFDPNDLRDVLANGNVVGRTEAELTLPPDFYRITLSGAGYVPAFWEGQVTGTLVTQPLVIQFSHA